MLPRSSLKRTLLLAGAWLLSIGLIAPTNSPAQLSQGPGTNSMRSVLGQVLTQPPVQPITSTPSVFVANLPRSNQPQQKQELSAIAVRKAIRFGVDFLKLEQRRDGSWQEVGDYDGGVTALVVLALINAGESPAAENIRAALDYLRTKKRIKTYCIALRVMAMVAADPKGKKYLATIKQDVDWLVKNQLKNGAWTYTADDGFRSGDASNSQFALLALHDASTLGKKAIQIPLATWQKADQYWKNVRSRTGAFHYAYAIGDDGNPRPASDALGSMVCAGIASTIIIQEHLVGDAPPQGAFAACCNGNVDDTIEKAFDWLAQRYTISTNPVGDNRAAREKHLYYLYALERAGRFSGRRFIGKNDWYRDGAKYLLKKQRANGAWQGSKGHPKEDNMLIATSYCLLFLSKGKRPIAMGKFNHGVADWDLHPQGVHYLTRRLESEWKQKLNWQTVKAEGSTVEDLFEAPVLFMSGQDVIGLTAPQKQTLKEYIENGGFLFAEACRGEGCADGAYNKQFIALMDELFPDSKLEPLDESHPVWNAHFPLLPNEGRPLLGLQACCRTSVIYCPTNLSCYWSLAKPSVMDSTAVNLNLKRRVEYAVQAGVNVVAYATGRELREKQFANKVKGEPVKMLNERSMVLPKLDHPGGSDDAPNAWRKVLEEMQGGLGFELKTEKKVIPPTVEAMIDYPFIFAHGRNRISFTPEQRSAIKNHLATGGFIFADSICASDAFTSSFREEIEKITGQAMRPIPQDHPIWTAPELGLPLSQVTLRTKDPKVQGGFRETTMPPQLEGIEMDGRLVVVFSPFDLSCALENTKFSNCDGYTRNDALQIAARVFLYYLRSEKQLTQ